MTTKEILLATIKELETGGWVQKRFSDGSGAVCVTQALFNASPNLRSYHKVRQLIIRQIDVSGLLEWNDHPQTTKEIVIEVLQRAANAT